MSARTRLPGTALIRGACLIVAGAGVVLGGAGVAGGGLIGSEDFTSWSQLYAAGSNREQINNDPDYDFSVNGAQTTKLCGLGLLKDGQIIGHMANAAPAGGHALYGKVNVDPSTSTPADNINALVVGESNNGMYGTIDENGNGKWGRIDFYNDGQVNVHVEDNELILDQDGFSIDGVRGDYSSMPAYGGAGSGTMHVPSIDMDTDYAIPEPCTVALMGAGALAVLGKKKIGGLVRKIFGEK